LKRLRRNKHGHVKVSPIVIPASEARRKSFFEQRKIPVKLE
jgi:hypothetical protein